MDEVEVSQICCRIECARTLAEERKIVPVQMHRMSDKIQKVQTWDWLRVIISFAFGKESFPLTTCAIVGLGQSISWLMPFKV